MHKIDAGLPLLRCPICGDDLSRDEKVIGCETGHRFDLARQGYLNLLGHAAPANADTAEMIASRARFLATGVYDPIATAVASAAEAHDGAIIEVGAGTGHYLQQTMPENKRNHLAIDISVAAAKNCARRGLAAVIADTWARLPVKDHSVGVLLCIFAPRNPAEFARILAHDGIAVVVTPTPDHLAELRAAGHLLDIPADKLTRLDESMGRAGFTLADRQEIAFQADLSQPQVRDLVGMGPNAFHSPEIPDITATQVAVKQSLFVLDH